MAKLSNKNNHEEIEHSSKLRFVHWVALLASVLLTLRAWYIAQHQHDTRVRDQFNRESRQLVHLISERMEKYADSLWAGVAAIYAKDYDINYLEWKTFASNLEMERKYPGINGVGVIFHLEPNELDEFLKEQRRLRPSFELHPPQKRSDYWPITYLEPKKGNEEAIGLDIAHEENRYRAALKARDSGEARITAPIILVQDETRTPGFLFYTPFYKGGEPDSVKERRERFLGLVYAPFVVSKLIYGTLERERRLIGVKISDQGQILYNEVPFNAPSFFSEASFKKTISMVFYGRTWTFDLRSTRAFEDATETNQPLIILAAGILINLLLFALFRNMAKSNAKAYQLAQRMSAEADVQKSAAIHASKLAALGEMAGGIAHEINNPLSVILNYASFLQELKKTNSIKDKPEIVEEAADKIEAAVTRITAIVEGLRTFSRDGSKDKFVLEDVNDIVVDALEFGKEQFKNKGIKLEYTPTPGVFVECQKVQVSQVLINLINNARFAAEKSEEKWVKISVNRTDKDMIQVKVCNSGAPITPEVRERLFQPFFTTKGPGKGTGLGLSISKGIVEAHEGRLFYDPSFDHTTFVIELPAAKGQAS